MYWISRQLRVGDMALVAVTPSPSGEEMLGAARLIREATLTRAEFSIMVADALHGQGIGAALLRQLIAAASTLNITKLVGYVLADNTQMLRLGRKAGFRQTNNREMGAIELAIDIPAIAADMSINGQQTSEPTDIQHGRTHVTV